MIELEIKNIDPGDISDLLVKVEKSFDIKFGDTELMHISTFGELCDHIKNKIKLETSNDCTSQQAFYKLRDAISTTFQIDKKNITTSLAFEDILPRTRRRFRIRKLEEKLGLKLYILKPPSWVTGVLVIILLASLVGLFIDWQIGLSGVICSLFGFWLSNKMGKELDLQTVGQVVEKMTRENYLKSRRNSNTFNQREIEKVLTDIFSKDLDIYKLTRDTKFE